MRSDVKQNENCQHV